MSNPGAGGGDKSSALTVEYEQVNENFRMLADIRFKLLALVPALGGAAIYMLTAIGESATADDFVAAKVILVGVMGFVATLGVTFYDQRNSELYNALIDRANFLEAALRLPRDEKANTREGPEEYRPFRGQFGERPAKGRVLLGREALKAGHDKGLALIYGTVLGGWFFPVVFAAARLRYERHIALRLALGAAAVAIVVAVAELIRQDRRESKARRQRVADVRAAGGEEAEGARRREAAEQARSKKKEADDVGRKQGHRETLVRGGVEQGARRGD